MVTTSHGRVKTLTARRTSAFNIIGAVTEAREYGAGVIDRAHEGKCGADTRDVTERIGAQ